MNDRSKENPDTEKQIAELSSDQSVSPQQFLRDDFGQAVIFRDKSGNSHAVDVVIFDNRNAPKSDL